MLRCLTPVVAPTFNTSHTNTSHPAAPSRQSTVQTHTPSDRLELRFAAALEELNPFKSFMDDFGSSLKGFLLLIGTRDETDQWQLGTIDGKEEVCQSLFQYLFSKFEEKAEIIATEELSDQQQEKLTSGLKTSKSALQKEGWKQTDNAFKALKAFLFVYFTLSNPEYVEGKKPEDLNEKDVRLFLAMNENKSPLH